MPRKTTIDETRLIGFGKWLMPNLGRKGWSVNRLAEAVGMDAGHLGKIIKAYEPQYSSYSRPGYEYTVAIGKVFGDTQGALVAAGYESELNTAPITYPEDSPAAMLLREKAEAFGVTWSEVTKAKWDEMISQIERQAELEMHRVKREEEK